MRKQKAKIYKGKRIVMGNKNLVTKNEIHVTDICDKSKSDGLKYRYLDLSKMDKDEAFSYALYSTNIKFSIPNDDGSIATPMIYWSCLQIPRFINSEYSVNILAASFLIGGIMDVINDDNIKEEISDEFVDFLVEETAAIEISEEEFFKIN